jgi:hypothetical protein
MPDPLHPDTLRLATAIHAVLTDHPTRASAIHTAGALGWLLEHPTRDTLDSTLHTLGQLAGERAPGS